MPHQKVDDQHEENLDPRASGVDEGVLQARRSEVAGQRDDVALDRHLEQVDRGAPDLEGLEALAEADDNAFNAPAAEMGDNRMPGLMQRDQRFFSITSFKAVTG